MSSVEIRSSRGCSRLRIVTMRSSCTRNCGQYFSDDGTRKSKTGTTLRGCAGFRRYQVDQFRSVGEAGAGRAFESRSRGAIFAGGGAGELRDLLQVIFGLLAVALFELPQAVILPGPYMVRIGLQRALVPDLRQFVVAE